MPIKIRTREPRSTGLGPRLSQTRGTQNQTPPTRPKELWEKIHYIHQNPVQRKLVNKSTDWNWSGAADFAKLRTGPLPLDQVELAWLR